MDVGSVSDVYLVWTITLNKRKIPFYLWDTSNRLMFTEKLQHSLHFIRGSPLLRGGINPISSPFAEYKKIYPDSECKSWILNDWDELLGISGLVFTSPNMINKLNFVNSIKKQQYYFMANKENPDRTARFDLKSLIVNILGIIAISSVQLQNKNGRQTCWQPFPPALQFRMAAEQTNRPSCLQTQFLN